MRKVNLEDATLSQLLGHKWIEHRVDDTLKPLLQQMQELPEGSPERFLLERQVRDKLDRIDQTIQEYAGSLRDYVKRLIQNDFVLR